MFVYRDLYNWFLETGSYYIVLAGLELAMCISLSLKSLRFPFLCLPNSGVKGVGPLMQTRLNLLALLLPKHESLTWRLVKPNWKFLQLKRDFTASPHTPARCLKLKSAALLSVGRSSSQGTGAGEAAPQLRLLPSSREPKFQLQGIQCPLLCMLIQKYPHIFK